MQRVLPYGFGIALLALSGAAALGASESNTPKPCATIPGPAWTQTINLNANLAPPKTANLREISGSRYYVFVDHIACKSATQHVARFLRLHTQEQVIGSKPRGYTCVIGNRHWYRDVYNGDAVRRSTPPISIGGCSTQKADAVPGVTYASFWWNPAKPCRRSFTTDVCRH